MSLVPKGNVLPPDKEWQATNDCGDKENESLPGMNPVMVISAHMRTSTEETESAACIK